jgi:hypothetical protein
LNSFSHENDYWDFSVRDNFGAGPRSCNSGLDARLLTPSELYARAFAASRGIVDLWIREESGFEGPASWLHPSQCDAGDRPYPVSGSCVYEEELFEARSRRIILAHDVSSPLFLYHAFHLVHEPLQVPEVWLTAFAHVPEPTRRRCTLARASPHSP